MRILNLPEFIQKRNPIEVVNGFGGKENYQVIIQEIEEEIYIA